MNDELGFDEVVLPMQVVVDDFGIQVTGNPQWMQMRGQAELVLPIVTQSDPEAA